MVPAGSFLSFFRENIISVQKIIKHHQIHTYCFYSYFSYCFTSILLSVFTVIIFSLLHLFYLFLLQLFYSTQCLTYVLLSVFTNILFSVLHIFSLMFLPLFYLVFLPLFYVVFLPLCYLLQCFTYILLSVFTIVLLSVLRTFYLQQCIYRYFTQYFARRNPPSPSPGASPSPHPHPLLSRRPAFAQVRFHVFYIFFSISIGQVRRNYYEGGGARTAKNHSNSDIPGSHTLVKQRKKPGVTSDTSDTSHSDACKNRNHKTSPNSYIFHTNLTMFSAFLHNYDVLLKKTQK